MCGPRASWRRQHRPHQHIHPRNTCARYYLLLPSSLSSSSTSRHHYRSQDRRAAAVFRHDERIAAADDVAVYTCVYRTGRTETYGNTDRKTFTRFVRTFGRLSLTICGVILRDILTTSPDPDVIVLRMYRGNTTPDPWIFVWDHYCYRYTHRFSAFQRCLIIPLTKIRSNKVCVSQSALLPTTKFYDL
jgi:hypothetical protein